MKTTGKTPLLIHKFKKKSHVKIKDFYQNGNGSELTIKIFFVIITINS